MDTTTTTDFTKLPDRNGEPITCHHEWHYAADGLPLCHDGSQGRRCEGETVQCGKGSAKCERHADRHPDRRNAAKLAEWAQRATGGFLTVEPARLMDRPAWRLVRRDGQPLGAGDGRHGPITGYLFTLNLPYMHAVDNRHATIKRALCAAVSEVLYGDLYDAAPEGARAALSVFRPR
jgi:hypothetical protein